MDTDTSSRTCTVRRNVTVKAWVSAEFPVQRYEYSRWKNGKRLEGTPDDYGKCLEAKCKEFEQFLRDHRSQDVVTLTVERERADLCSACNAVWESDKDPDGQVFCASCGAVLDTSTETT
jgi:hypothetical protein